MASEFSRNTRQSSWVLAGVAAVVAAAIGLRLTSNDGTASATPVADVMPAPGNVYDPVQAGETLPDGYRRGLARDQILPVYDPVFTAASQVDWPVESLVIGVVGAETAKAYPVTHLNSREMVIDSLDGIPILVSW